MRRHLTFTCANAECFGTLDRAKSEAGLLIVSGGNEIRAGSHRGMAKLAADIAAAGYPVFRYDRRGVGDSAGKNKGFDSSGPDMAAALSAFYKAQPQLKHIIAYGNCDAATALLLHRPRGIHALILSNPYLVYELDDVHSPAAMRAYYAAQLRNPRAWLRLLHGAVNVRAAARDFSTSASPTKASPLAQRVSVAMLARPITTSILLARHDGTAANFVAQWGLSLFERISKNIVMETIDTASHSFASAQAYTELRARILTVLRSG